MKRARLGQLRRSDEGSTAIEFALLAPAFFMMVFGVLQVGIATQNYNAVRNVAADVARYAMIQYINGTPPTDTQLQDKVTSIGEAAPYLLNSSLHATVVDVTTPQVSGTVEMTLTITYTIPSLLDGLGLSGPSITYTRPIIVTAT